MAAIAVTSGTPVFENAGSFTMWTADVTSVDDADTFAAATVCGFGQVFNAIFQPTVSTSVNIAISGTNLTFKVASGTLSGRLTVFGK